MKVILEVMDQGQLAADETEVVKDNSIRMTDQIVITDTGRNNDIDPSVIVRSTAGSVDASVVVRSTAVS